MSRQSLFYLCFLTLIFANPSPLLANWTLNLGYNNPPSATVGANFLYFAKNFAFEIGLGWVDGEATSSDDDDEDNNPNDADDGEDRCKLSVRKQG